MERNVLCLFFVVSVGSCSSGPIITGPPDLAKNLGNHINNMNGQVGDPCLYTCDCEPGLSCSGPVGSKTCQMDGTSFCCSSPKCPAGLDCETATGGHGQCGANPGDMAVNQSHDMAVATDSGTGTGSGTPDLSSKAFDLASGGFCPINLCVNVYCDTDNDCVASNPTYKNQCCSHSCDTINNQCNDPGT